tara:strand:+ start:6214 stop:6555 length:342 start_codon:yes stop_codon:yes gene_type:complete
MHISAFVKVDNGMFIERPQENMVSPEYEWVPLPDDGPNPDPINQRYSGDPEDPFRAATPEEVAEALDYKANMQAEDRLSESVQTQAMVDLLVEKSVITRAEYIDSLKDLLKES